MLMAMGSFARFRVPFGCEVLVIMIPIHMKTGEMVIANRAN
jgi:hypothetical protein